MAKSEPLPRRRFINRVISLAAGAGVISGVKGAAVTPVKPTDPKTATAGGQVVTRVLGRTGLTLPVVSMGVMNASNPKLLQRAYEVGVRHFDTAAFYQRGRNEEMVGQVIKELGARDKVVIATKVYLPEEQRNIPAAQVRDFYLKGIDESLKRLQTEQVDIFYSHSIAEPDFLHNPGVLEAMNKIKEQKKARFVGFSTHNNMTALINSAVKSEYWDVILTAFNYSHGDDEGLKTAIQAAAGKNIGIVAMKTQCSQYWYREDVPARLKSFYTGAISQTAVLKWVLRHPHIATAIPGYTTFEQLEMDFAVARNLELTSEENKFLSDRQVKLALAYCLQCRQCENSCPYGVDIPTLMRTHMYTACYGNFSHARATFAEIPDNRSLTRCSQCDGCRAVCRNGIEIGERISDLRHLLA